MDPSDAVALGIARAATGPDDKNMSKRFVFTLQAGHGDVPTCRYPVLEGTDFYCGQLERGRRGGNLHWQCYVRFAQKKRFATVCRLIQGAHIEFAEGNEQQCNDYCQKEESFIPPAETNRFF